MNNFTQETVDKLADLLLIGLTPEENTMVFEEFAIIDEEINKINELDNLKNVKPMTHALDDFSYELRDDVFDESIPIEELLQNCDNYDDREVSIVKVVG